jgi:hypothetical protein
MTIMLKTWCHLTLLEIQHKSLEAAVQEAVTDSQYSHAVADSITVDGETVWDVDWPEWSRHLSAMQALEEMAQLFEKME